ncbi:zinc ribbon domain-containing protein [Streptomyces cadmiisoli]|uniref:Cas12f1-like TNB domain-containing protein n=2 Tax=Streptomyces cadmiisoli TaxID=2184053 RepID=A0A2Z4IS68_9ACTN|nr:hypothetical protein DN051_01900 [Streptomyces cadmiisoli]
MSSRMVRMFRPCRQLGSFIAYQAQHAGEAGINVNPACTSQCCLRCGRNVPAGRPSLQQPWAGSTW